MQTVPQFQSYQSVRIIGEGWERTGQVGVYVGPGEEPGEVSVKFEGVPTETDQFPAQVIDTFPADAVGSI